MRILTFDIEEWFHILDNLQTKGEKEWASFESRIHKNMETIFKITDKFNISATFFVVGWIAEKHPQLIKEISRRGFEIGSHTHLHQLVYDQNRKKFFADVKKSIETLEDCTGKKVESFRAPGFSITEENKWAFEVLYELGIKKDSSVFPAGRSHGGFPSYNQPIPSILKYNGVTIKEFPINTHNLFGKPIIFSGGGYFRLHPYYFIKRWTRKSDYVMTYFHPRDFDFPHPVIPGLSLSRQFKSYVGLKKCKNKLEQWLVDFDFIDLEQANKKIIWSEAPVVTI